MGNSAISADEPFFRGFQRAAKKTWPWLYLYELCQDKIQSEEEWWVGASSTVTDVIYALKEPALIAARGIFYEFCGSVDVHVKETWSWSRIENYRIVCVNFFSSW